MARGRWPPRCRTPDRLAPDIKAVTPSAARATRVQARGTRAGADEAGWTPSPDSYGAGAGIFTSMALSARAGCC